MQNEHLRLILGLKINQARIDKELSLQALSKQVGLSVSYLNEIEKGKKYPKPERIQKLSEALDISYDELVSQKFSSEQSYLEQLLQSAAMQKFPFHLFGITLQDVISLVPNAPKEGRALVKALIDVARGYGMRVEDFFHTALRCYQEMHQNYFEDLEQAVDDFRKECGWKEREDLNQATLAEVLEKRFGFSIDEELLANNKHLAGMRSMYAPGKNPKLYLNGQFSEVQKAFLIGREIGFQVLGLEARGHCSPDIEVSSFEQVLNAFKASYFSSALFMNRSRMRGDLKEFFSLKQWDPEAFKKMLNSYYVTPEMFFYRLSELIPHYFGINRLHFLRFDWSSSTDAYVLEKQLNMSQVRIPTGFALKEQFCRRWLSIQIIKDLDRALKKKDVDMIVGAQRSEFLGDNREFLCIALARPMVLEDETLSSITIGFEVNSTLKRTIKFWRDPEISDVLTNETCQRCSLSEKECEVRAAPPTIYQIDRARELQRQEVHALVNNE